MNKQFKTPLDIAIERNHTEIEAYLREFLLKAFRGNQDAMRDQLARHLAEDQQQAALQQLQEGLHLPPHAITPETLANRWLAGMDNFLQGNHPPADNGPAAASSSSSSGNGESDDIYRKADELARCIIEGIRQNEHQLSPKQREEFRQITVESLRPYTIPAVKHIEARMAEMEQIEQLFKTDVTNSDPESNNASDAEEDPSDSTSTSSEELSTSTEEEEEEEKEEDVPKYVETAYVVPAKYYFMPGYRVGNVKRIHRSVQEFKDSFHRNTVRWFTEEQQNKLRYISEKIQKEQYELTILYRDMKANSSKRGGDSLFFEQDTSKFDKKQLKIFQQEVQILQQDIEHVRQAQDLLIELDNIKASVHKSLMDKAILYNFAYSLRQLGVSKMATAHMMKLLPRRGKSNSPVLVSSTIRTIVDCLPDPYMPNFENDYRDEALSTYFHNCGKAAFTDIEKYFVARLDSRYHASFASIMQRLGQPEPVSKQDFVNVLHAITSWDDIISSFHFVTKPIILTFRYLICNQRLIRIQDRISYFTPMILKVMVQSTPQPLGKTMQLTSMNEIRKRIHKLTLAIEEKLQQPTLMLKDGKV